MPKRAALRKRERQERAGADAHGRLMRRARVMAAFTDRPGELLDPNQVGEATHLPADLAKSICVALEVSGWLQPGRNELGHPAWRRPASNGNGDGHQDGQDDQDDQGSSRNGDQPQPPQQQLPSRPRRPGPGDDFYCRTCHRAETSPVPPPGWFRVQQRHHGADQPGDRIWFTRGLYCSVACVVADAEATG